MVLFMDTKSKTQNTYVFNQKMTYFTKKNYNNMK